MVYFAIASAIVLPALMFFGGLAAWRASRSRQVELDSPSGEAWRDDSMDDWRKERDASAETERIARLTDPEGTLKTGRAEEQEETQRQQRIGG
ncbi:MAG: hypothetical protein WEC33_07310 [Dehalococcoidia bacterium]